MEFQFLFSHASKNVYLNREAAKLYVRDFVNELAMFRGPRGEALRESFLTCADGFIDSSSDQLSPAKVITGAITVALYCAQKRAAR